MVSYANLKKNLSIAAVGFLIVSNSLVAAEISFFSGGLKSTKDEQGTAEVKSQEISFGLTYEEAMGGNLAWFASAEMGTVSYSGDSDLDDATNFALGGGVKHYFDKISDTFVPYLSAYGRFVSNKEPVVANTEKEETGIYYGINTGLKMYLGGLSEFQMDDLISFLYIDLNLMESALSASEKETTTTRDPTSGEVRKNEEERSRTELYIDTANAFTEIKVGFGLKF